MNFSKTGQNLSLDRKKTNLLDAVYYTLESISFENDHQKNPQPNKVIHNNLRKMLLNCCSMSLTKE